MARFTREQLRDELQRLARAPVHLTLTSNASSYISFSPAERPLRVRLQRLFLQAPDDVLVALGRWLGGRERSCPKAVRRFIDCPPPEAARLAYECGVNVIHYALRNYNLWLQAQKTAQD